MTELSRHKTVLIVGAGPTGLAAAIELSRQGVAVRIIDKKSRPTPLSKAVVINARTLELMEASGLTPKLIDKGIKIEKVIVHDSTLPLLNVYTKHIRHRYNFLLAMPQSETEQTMVEHLRLLGVEVEWEKEFMTLTQDMEGVETTIQDVNGTEETVRTDYLFAADGAHSAVRKHFDIDFPGGQYPYEWNLVDVVLNGPYDEHLAKVFSFPHGRVLLVIPLGNGIHRLISTTKDAIAMLPEGMHIKETLWESDFHVSHRLAETFSVDHVFLGGDAVHIHSPAGGRGMNLGIEDGCEFAYRLIHGGLNSYSSQRREVAQGVIRQTDIFFKIGVADNRLLRWVRRLMLPLIMGQPFMQAKALTSIAGLSPERRMP